MVILLCRTTLCHVAIVRVFRSNVNLLLHVYWYAYKKHPTGIASTSSTSHEDEDELDDSTGQNKPSVCNFNFVASPGWINRFNNRYDIKNLKQKGEKGSADYAAIEPWLHDWLRTVAEEGALYQCSLAQILTIIMNFDEAGIQYKSVPQRSYVDRNLEIKAKKNSKI